MLAWIYVADNPYYAVTKKDGTFSIPEPLPGSYTLVAWHAYNGGDGAPGDGEGQGDRAGQRRAEEEVVPQSGTGASKESAMDDNQKERSELHSKLVGDGERPDRSLVITRRTFLHKSLLTGAAGVATYGWFPLINTLDLTLGAQQGFKFAWISDNHLYPKDWSTRASSTRPYARSRSCRR